MDKEISFLNNYYKKAIKLSNDFSITRDFEWTPLLILSELSVQMGQIYNIVYQSEAVNEPNRSFNNLGDELSDVFLQLIALSDSMNIDMYHIKTLKPLKEDSWYSLPILLGQLNESIMEKYGYRFNKPRSGFDTTDEFIENRILRLFDITYQIAQKFNMDIEEEFQIMLDDANGFLDRFKRKTKYSEYVDAYNENHEYIGRFEKSKVHELGLWHDVFGALVINPNTNEVFFQLKNYKHNNVNDRDLLEITAGGHLQASETVEDGVREIKEETGLDVLFDDLEIVGMRKCDVDNNMIIREFQHYYLLPLDVSINDLNIFDEEVKGFVKVNIDDALKILSDGISIIGTYKTVSGVINKTITIRDFDQAFVNNGVFISLLSSAKEYINNKNREIRK